MFSKVLFVLLLLCQIAQPVGGQSTQPKTTKAFPNAAQTSPPVAFPNLGLRLQPPIGFEKATRFYGFQHPKTGASILVSSIPGPFDAIVSGFTPEQLQKRGIHLLSQESRPNKRLFQVSQAVNGQTYFKWLLLMADQQNETKLIMATFPKAEAKNLNQPLKRAVLSASLIAQNTDSSTPDIPFSITPSSLLAEVPKLRGVGKMLAFSKEGAFPTPSPDAPIFIVAPSLGEVAIANQKDYALKRLSQFSQIQDLDVESVDAIAINNQEGVEIIANAKDKKSQTPLKVYQVMLFSKTGGYVVMLGIVGQDEAEQYLPEFQAMAKTFQHHPQ